MVVADLIVTASRIGLWWQGIVEGQQGKSKLVLQVQAVCHPGQLRQHPDNGLPHFLLMLREPQQLLLPGKKKHSSE